MPVLTAVTGAVWETDLVSALNGAEHGVTVVRRCVDLAELLSVAATGTARAVLLSADLRRLDRDSVNRLGSAGVAVVGLVDPGDAAAAARMSALGIEHVLPADAGVLVIAAAVRAAVAGDRDDQAPSRRFALADPQAALRTGAGEPTDEQQAADPGRLIAVWGPTGAPGRTTVAVGIADEISRLGALTLLVDADVYGGVIAQVLGLLDESPGLTAAVRQAGTGALDQRRLAGLSWSISPTLRILTGISRADRWPELRPAALERVLQLARAMASVVVVDCGFCLEQDEELAYDTVAPRRNGATLAILAAADEVLCVSGADPVSLQRAVRALTELREVLPHARPRVVVNRVRPVVVPGNPRIEIGQALLRFAGVAEPAFLPQDTLGADSALAAGRTLADVSPKSPLRLALRQLAMELSGITAAGPRRRRR